MLCSAAELGLGDDHAGILDPARPTSTPGTPFAEALGIERRRALRPRDQPQPARRHVGRRRGPRPGRPPRRCRSPSPSRRPTSVAGDAAVAGVSVEIVDPDLCGRFHARVLDGRDGRPVARAGSPSASPTLGMRPINNVVDVSNYVMLELGQPNHTYDLAKRRRRRACGCAGPATARRSSPSTTSSARSPADDLLICDGDDAAVGIAGVMGGASTEIGDTTTDVLLEMAWWHPMAIARSVDAASACAREASARFERGTDPEVVDLAARRFAELLAPSGARLVDGLRSTVDGDLPDRTPGRASAPTGSTACSAPTSSRRRDRRRCSSPSASPSSRRRRRRSTVTIPTFRPDTADRDRRHRGGRPPPRLRARIGQARCPRSVHDRARSPPRQRERRRSASCSSGLGLCTRPCRCRSSRPGDLARCRPAAPTAIALTNPLVAEESVLRTSLRPGLLRAVAYNESHRNRRRRACSRSARSSGLPARRHDAARRARAPRPSCSPGARPPRRSQRLAGRCAEALGVAGRRASTRRRAARAAPDRAALASSPATVAVGAVGEIDPGVLDALGIGERVAWLEVDLDAAAGPAPRRAPLPAGQPLPVERHRPGLRGRRGRARPATSRPPSAARPATCSSTCALFDVFRGAAGAPRAAAAWPTACGSRPPTAPSPTTTSPRSAPRWSPPSRAPSAPPSAPDPPPRLRRTGWDLRAPASRATTSSRVVA